MSNSFSELAREAAAWIRDANELVVAAGAGMGVDSGLPDFRGTEGFWKAYPALGFQASNQTSALREFPRIATACLSRPLLRCGE